MRLARAWTDGQRSDFNIIDIWILECCKCVQWTRNEVIDKLVFVTLQLNYVALLYVETYFFLFYSLAKAL